MTSSTIEKNEPLLTPIGVVEPRLPSSAVRVLQLFVILLAGLPARLVFAPLGAFGSPASVVGLAGFGLWATSALERGFLARKLVPLRVAVSLFWVAGLLSYAVMHLHSTPGDEVNAADRWVLFMFVWSGVALLGGEGLRHLDDVLRVLRVAIAAAGFSASVAILQARFNFDATLQMAKLPGLSVAGELESVLSRSGLRRPAGTATHPIEFGCMLAMTLGPALVLAIHDTGWAIRRRCTALGLIGLGIPMAVSRSAILGAAIVAAFWFTAADRAMRIKGAISLAVFSVVIFMTSPGLIGTLLSYFENASTDSSITTRTDDYAAVARFVRQSPLIGRGPQTFLPKFRILDNQWLAQLIETGIIGTLALLGYYLLPALFGRLVRRDATDPLMRAMGTAFVGMSVVVIVESMTFDFYAYPMDPGFLALFIGLAGAMYGFRNDIDGESAVLVTTSPAVDGTPPPVVSPTRARTRSRRARVGARKVSSTATMAVATPSKSRSAAMGRVRSVSRRSSRLRPGSTSRARPTGGEPMRAQRALKWSLVAQFVARAGSFLLGLVLARLLSPSEFGTYTVALGLFTLLLTIDDLGVLKGLVRWPGEFSEIAPTARTLATISSTAMYLITFTLAPYIARAAGTPGASAIMRVLCLGILLDAVLQVVPGAALQRQMRQDLWVIVEGSRLVTNAAVTIPLAATGSGVWALVIGALAGQAVSVMATWILAKVPFTFGYDRVKARELLRTSFPYSIAAFLGAALLIVDYLVIGRLLGPTAVGVYLIAFNVSSWPITLVGAAVRAVAVPGLSKMHHAGGDTGPVLRRGLTLLLAGGAPFVTLLMTAPNSVIGALYGAQWVPGGVALRFLAIMAIVRLLDGLIEDALFA
ncbi:MAG: oligosaccharide flippase family protein, partial [Ilumatobacteraceae bacterium]